jgi:hypothetical protein
MTARWSFIRAGSRRWRDRAAQGYLKTIGPEVAFFHWGDIDPGDVRIFRFLEDTLPRAPIPFRMSQILAETHGRRAPRDPTLGAIANSNCALAAWLSQGEDIRYLEQEAQESRFAPHEPID